MSLNALRKGTSVLIGSARFLILKKLDLDSWQLENVLTGEWSVFTEHDLLDRFANAELVFVNDEANDGNAPADRALAGYPPDLIAAAQNRIQYLKEIDRRQPIALTAKRLESLVSGVADQIRDAHTPSWRTLSRDYRKWLASRRDIRAIIPRHGDRGGRGSQMLPEVSAIADAVIEELYMTPERKRVPEVHLEIVRRLAGTNSFRPLTDQLPIPSRRTVYREIARRPPFEVIAARYGKRHAEMKFRTSGAGPEAVRALQRVSMDHTPSDLVVVDDNSMLPRGRPTITSAIDEYTRCPMGFYAGFEPPSCLSVMRCLSRDGRSDCKQVIVALVITPEGFPLAYEVMDGNTSDKTTLRGFLSRIEGLYGKARRVWLMDRGIPTEAILAEMRDPERQMFYLVGTSKARVSKFEKHWLDLPWQKVRDSVAVKLFSRDGELYVLAKSEGRQQKEIAIRRKKLARLLRKLRAMRRSCPKRDQLLMRVGAAKTEAGRAFGFVKINLPKAGQEVTRQSFTFQVDKAKLNDAELRDGHYLLRTNLVAEDPAVLWDRYIQLTQIEAAFKCLKSDLGIRPIYHQLEHRVEAHILVAFLAYCPSVTLKHRLQMHAPGLTPRAVLEKLSAIQMIDVIFPTTDGRCLMMPRYTEPEADLALLLHQLRLTLPNQPPPRISALTPEATPALKM